MIFPSWSLSYNVWCPTHSSGRYVSVLATRRYFVSTPDGTWNEYIAAHIQLCVKTKASYCYLLFTEKIQTVVNYYDSYTHTHTHTHTKKCYFKSLGKCYGCSLSHCEAMVSESLPEIVFSLWGTHDPHPSPQAAVVHGSAQPPLVLISVIHFNCFQVCCPIKATNSIQLSIHDCKSNLQQEIL